MGGLLTTHFYSLDKTLLFKTYTAKMLIYVL
jgi:hypothetical protein